MFSCFFWQMYCFPIWIQAGVAFCWEEALTGLQQMILLCFMLGLAGPGDPMHKIIGPRRAKSEYVSPASYIECLSQAGSIPGPKSQLCLRQSY